MKQMKLPFDPVKERVPPATLAAVLTRLARIESRLVQLMKHQGMRDDGRQALPSSTDSLKE
jgi:hypothetical protein